MSAVSTVCLLAGDLTITSNSKVKGPMGMNGEGVQTQYYSVNFQKTVDEGTKIDTLVDYDKGVFYTINHKDKKIDLMTFDDLVAIGEAMEAKLAQMANLPKFLQGAMGGGDPGEVKVEKLGDGHGGRPGLQEVQADHRQDGPGTEPGSQPQAPRQPGRLRQVRQAPREHASPGPPPLP